MNHLHAMKNFLNTFLMASCLLVISLARGQQNTADNLNTPGNEHKILATMQGNWDVALKIPIGNGRFIDGKTSCVADWVIDGRFMRLEYNSTFQGRPLTVVRYIGFDRHTNKFTETHFESTHTDVMNSEGSISADGRTITCWGKHVDVAINQSVKVRTVTTFVDKYTFILEMVYTDSAGVDAKTVTLTHKRRI